MTGEFVAILALLSIIGGLMIVAVVQLGIIAWHLGDLKAYTMTQIAVLQDIRGK